MEVRFRKGGSHFFAASTSEQNVRYSHRKGSERRSSEIPRGQAGYQEASDVQEGCSRNKNDTNGGSAVSWL